MDAAQSVAIGTRGDQVRTAIVPTIAALGAQVWDRLARGSSLYQSYPWLLWAESHVGLRAAYVVAHDTDDTLLGAVPAYLMVDVPDRFSAWYDPVRLFLARHCDVADAAPRWFPVLLLGSCSGYHSDVLVRPGLRPKRRAEVVQGLTDRCHELAEAWSARSTMILYAPRSVADSMLGTFRTSTAPIPTSAEAVVELDPDLVDFAGYLAQFPSARRYNLRKEIAGFEAAGGQVSTRSLGAVVDRIGPLLARLQRKYGNPVTDGEMTAYLASQEPLLGRQSTVFVHEHGGRLSGFALCYTHGDTIYVRAGGFDDDAGAPPYSYFNLGMYAPIRHAICHGLTAVDLGTGAYRAKVLRGAQVRPLWSIVRPPDQSEPAWLAALRHPGEEAVEAGYV